MQRPTRSSVDRAGMSREKRSLERVDGNGSKDAMPEEKRQKLPALASVIVEAVKMDSLQKLCSSLEPVLRRVVGEEVERALAKLMPNRLVGVRSGTSPKRIQGSDAGNLRLQFRNKLALPLFTGSKVEGEQGLPIHIVLQDISTGQVYSTGPESAAKLEVVVLEGDFGNDDDEDWTEEDFESHVVKERDGKRPLLTGDLTVTLKEGVGTLGELTFTDNSSWIRSRKFRLGVKIASGFCEGLRIREAKTDSFTVKDHRGELYKKHYPPALNDEVWRLDKIGKDGAFHKRLNESGIRTVEDFLRFVVMDLQKLRTILGSGMSNKMWEGTVEHAKTCVLSGKLYVYYTDNSRNIGVIFNNIYELMGLIANNRYMSVESLTENEKVYVDKLVKVAYENWSNVVEYDGEALISEKPHKVRGVSSHTEDSITGSQQAAMYTQTVLASQPVNLQHASVATAVSSSPVGGQVQSYDYRPETSTRYAGQDQQPAESSQMFSMGYNLPSQAPIGVHQNLGSSNEATMTGLALGPPQSMISSGYGFQPVPFQAGHAGSVEWARARGQEPFTPAGHVDDYITEEELRARSMELLENEEMQQLLRLQYPYNTNGNFQGEDAYAFSGFAPSPSVSFSEDRGRASGKAYVGWLKLKAALRWGIFIRKIAAEKAEKRAQLEELEDEEAVS